MNNPLICGAIILGSFATGSLLLQYFNEGSKQEMLLLQVKNRQLAERANGCQTEVNRLEENFQIYREAIKDSRD
jgi:hypothetical protein